jgi:competence protein ComEA
VAEVSRQQVVLWALALAAVGLIGARYLKEEGGAPAAVPRHRQEVRLERAGGGVAWVHVTGAVRRPGVYRLPAWARLDLAVRRAGGPTGAADLQAVNLAAKVGDGQQVVVPRRMTAGPVAAGPDAAAGASPGAPGALAPPVSLSTATAEQLDQLDGVGPATAQKILDWRREHGGFRSVDDLKNVSGIGPKRFAALKDRVRM